MQLTVKRSCSFLAGSPSVKSLLIMKMTFLLVLTACLQASAGANAQKISLSEQNASLQSVLNKIERQSGYFFVYRNEWLKDANKVSFNIKDAPIKQALDACFSNQPLTYTIINKNIIIRQKPLPPPQTPAEESEVSRPPLTGSVTDSASGSPLEGVTIQVKGTATGTTTDAEGRFSLEVPDNAVLVISYLGYTQRQIRVNGKKVLSIALAPATTGLDQLVVVGYGTQKKKDIIGAVSIVNTDDLKSAPSSNVVAQLQGRAPGVTVSSSGDPGSSAIVRIRGFSSFGNNSPLYIIDGTPTTNVSSLNPEDIESMQVLKDASSASIYGARAANGVIIITTKHGKANKTTITFNSYVGVEQIPYSRIPKMLNTPELVQYLSQSSDDSYIDPVFGKKGSFTIPDMYVVSNAFRGGVSADDPRADPDLYTISDYYNIYQIFKTSQGTDWFRAMSQKSVIQSHELSASGGTDRSTYFLGLNYFNQDGVFKYTGYNRYSARMNAEFTLTSYLKIGENMQVSYGNRKGDPTINGETSAWANAYRSSPFVPVHDIKGGWGGSLIGGTAFGSNPVAQLYRRKDWTNKTLGAFGNIYAEVKFLKGLTGRASLGIDAASQTVFQPSRKQYEQAERQTYTQLTEGATSHFNWTWTNTLNYQKTINNQDINILLGTEAIKNTGRGISAFERGYDYETTNFLTLNTGLPQTLGDIGASNPVTGTSTLYSYFARADYAFKSKYLVNATFRRDGSSVFGADVRYGNFPSFGVGWVLSEENFMKDINWINELKLRGGWGEMGSISNVPGINQYSTFSSTPKNNFYDISGANTSTTQGYGVSTEGNEKTKWETTATTNIGIDALVYDHWNISVDVYRKNTKGLLVPSLRNGLEPLVSKPLINLGTMRNTGIDIQVGTQGKFTSDLKYDISLTFTHYKNELTKLNDQNTPLYLAAGRLNNVLLTTKGQPVSSFYGYVIDGFYNNQQDVDKGPTINDMPVQIGSWRFKDLDGDGNITPADETVLGSPHPDFQAGLNIGLTYKHFDFTTFLFWNYGNQIFNYTKFFTYMGVLNGGVAKGKLYDAWTPETASSAKTPRLGVGLDNGYTSFVTGNPNSFYVENGSYLRMKNLQIGYTFPQVIVSKLKFSNLRLYLQAENLFLITKYTGADPDMSLISGDGTDQSLGVDYSGYPHTKAFLAGINISF